MNMSNALVQEMFQQNGVLKMILLMLIKIYHNKQFNIIRISRINFYYALIILIYKIHLPFIMMVLV